MPCWLTAAWCLQGRKNNCIAVIGDGAITGGMAYEAMNHAGFLDKNVIVILNDNQQVSAAGCHCAAAFACATAFNAAAASGHVILHVSQQDCMLSPLLASAPSLHAQHA